MKYRQTIRRRQSPLSGDRDITPTTHKRERQGSTGILPVDVPLCSTLEIVGRTNTLYGRTVLIRYHPDFLFHNTRKASNPTIHTHNLFHHSLSLSLLLLISSLYQPYLELSREIFGFLCQEILTKLFCIFGMIGIRFAMCCKLLCDKHLRQNRPARIVVSTYTTRVCVNYSA
jgi:hypothetical protein